MKNLILIVFTLILPLTLLAQKPRIEQFKDYRTETYSFVKGRGDSVCFAIRDPNDTFRTTHYYRNGINSNIVWLDSMHSFDVKGRLRMVRHSDTKKTNLGHYSLWTYNAKGQTLEFSSKTTDKSIVQRRNDNGSLMSADYIEHTPSVMTQKTMSQNGITLSSKKIDTTYIKADSFTVVYYDTLFHKNGKPYSISSKKGNKFDILESFGERYFDENGQLLYAILPDSLRLFPFKDNVDCYYGLKTMKGDTIMKPRFDRVSVNRADNLIAGYEGDYCRLFTMDGKPFPLPSDRLTALYPLSQVYVQNLSDKKNKYEEGFNRLIESNERNRNKLYVFVEDSHKYGVMDKKGNVIITPQYLTLSNYYIGDNRFFSFVERQGDSVLSLGYLDRRGKPIFAGYKRVASTEVEDYFVIGRELPAGYYLRGKIPVIDPQNNYVGLGKGGEEAIILEPKYEYINFNYSLSAFVVSLRRNVGISKKDDDLDSDNDIVHGIFEPRSRKWILEAKDYQILNLTPTPSSLNDTYWVIKNVNNNNYCLIDSTGKFIIKPTLKIDSIGIANSKKGLYWIKKKGKYHIMDIRDGVINIHQTAFDYLSHVTLSGRYVGLSQEYEDYFLAKKGGKWALIESDEKNVLPYEFDYASRIMGNYYGSDRGLFLVKNDKAHFFNLESLPFDTPDFPFELSKDRKNQAFYSLPLADNVEGLFFINDTGKVIVPPQYKRLATNNESTDYELVEDAKKNRKLLFEDIGKAIDIPFKQNIFVARSNCPVLLIRDSTEVSFGVYSTSGKLLTPPINYGVAIGDLEKGIYFVKRDTPIVQRYGIEDYEVLRVNRDSINIEDQGWVMHNSEGKQLMAQSFRFPISFENGIGIGVQGDEFNLFNTEGVVVSPFYKDKKEEVERNFNNIRRVKPHNYYALYRNQGLSPTLILTDKTGQILVENGRYDGISDFFGPYAMVSAGGRVGLIDSLGNEVVKPLDLLSAKTQFMDSINFENRVMYSVKATDDFLDFYSKYNYNISDQKSLPFSIYTGEIDLSKDSTQYTPEERTTILNLLIQSCQKSVINKAQNAKIPRSYLSADAGFVFYEENYRGTNDIYALSNVNMTKDIVSYTLTDNGLELFYNFKLENNHWTEKNLFQLLDLQGDKRWALNDILTQKSEH